MEHFCFYTIQVEVLQCDCKNTDTFGKNKSQKVQVWQKKKGTKKTVKPTERPSEFIKDFIMVKLKTLYNTTLV